MKIIGIVLMLAAVLVGGFLLSDTIPGYMRNKEHLQRTRTEAAEVEKKLAAVDANATEAQIEGTLRNAERTVQRLRFAQESVVRRRNESLVVGGASLAVFALGAFAFARSRRKRPTAGGVSADAVT